MSKFEIKNFFQFEDGSAKFSLNTEAGFYYEMKLVVFSGGSFITSAQSRPYDKSDGTKGYANAFGALKDTKAAEFFDEVAEEAKKLLKVPSSAGNANNSGQSEEPPFAPDDDIPF